MNYPLRPMGFNEYQQQAARTLIKPALLLPSCVCNTLERLLERLMSPLFGVAFIGNSARLLWNAIGIAGECGEVSQVAVSLGSCLSQNIEDEKDCLANELGDMLWYLSAIATVLQIDMDLIGQDLDYVRPDPSLLQVEVTGLSVATADLLETIKKAQCHRHKTRGELPDAIVPHLVKVFHQWHIVAGRAGISFDAVARKNLQKLRERYPKKFSFALSRH